MTQNPWGPSSSEPQQGGWGQPAAPYGQPSASAPYGQPSASAPYGQPSASVPSGQPSASAYGQSYAAPQRSQQVPTRFPQPSQSATWHSQHNDMPGAQPGYGQQPRAAAGYEQPDYRQQPYATQGYGAQGYGQPGHAPQGYDAPGWGAQQTQPAWPQPQQPNPYGTAAFQAQPAYPAQPGAYFEPPQTQPVYPAQAPWGYPAQPPPPKRSGWLGALITLLAFVVLAGAAITVFTVTRRSPDVGPTAATPSATPTSPYMNDGYQVPQPDPNPGRLPVPSTEAQMKEWMESNALYTEAVPTPIRCEVPDLDLETATNTELQGHINEEVACLMRSWALPVQQAGFTLYRPTVTVYENSISTGCGTAKDKNAFYCGADQQIYYARNVYLGMPEEMQGKRWTVEAIVAHEFGHAIQARTGILVALHDYQQTSSGKPIKNELNRRLETQADCFGGVFLQQVSQSMKMTPDEVKLIKHMFFDFGDDQQSGDNHIDGDHGFGTSREYWMDQGLNAKTYAACNTFTAPSGQVR